MTDLALTSFGSLNGSNGNKAEQLRRATTALEQHFLQELLKHALPGDDTQGQFALERSAGMRQAQELYHQALAEHAAGSLGVAAALEAQLARDVRQPDGGGST